MSDERPVDLALEVGKVAGAMGQQTQALSEIRAGQEHVVEQLSAGSVRMSEIESTLKQVLEQQKITNGRIGKIEKAAERLAKRVGLLEAWRSTITFLPRMVDRFIDHKMRNSALLSFVALLVGTLLGYKA